MEERHFQFFCVPCIRSSHWEGWVRVPFAGITARALVKQLFGMAVPDAKEKLELLAAGLI
jgi:hypothetical protein